MNIQDVTIGQEVVRSKGDYVVGRIGNIVAINIEKNRSQVQWNGNTKTWVSISAIEPTSIPYTISKTFYDQKTGKRSWPKYSRV